MESTKRLTLEEFTLLYSDDLYDNYCVQTHIIKAKLTLEMYIEQEFENNYTDYNTTTKVCISSEYLSKLLSIKEERSKLLKMFSSLRENYSKSLEKTQKSSENLSESFGKLSKSIPKERFLLKSLELLEKPEKPWEHLNKTSYKVGKR